MSTSREGKTVEETPASNPRGEKETPGVLWEEWVVPWVVAQPPVSLNEASQAG